MKYLKRIYENFSSESDFENYLKNHFEGILDEDNSTYKDYNLLFDFHFT